MVRILRTDPEQERTAACARDDCIPTHSHTGLMSSRQVQGWVVASPFLGPSRLQWATMEFKRITTDAAQMGGVPCLRGLRIPVATVVALVAEGETVERILALYPDLEADDVREALLFAAAAVRERTLPLAAGQ